jgi:hypothetical protein
MGYPSFLGERGVIPLIPTCFELWCSLAHSAADAASAKTGIPDTGFRSVIPIVLLNVLQATMTMAQVCS